MSSQQGLSGSRLFTPMTAGGTYLTHRIVMAPLTRFRCTDSHIPLPFVKEYYEQRACVPGTLLISEATAISPQAGGQRNIPGIWSQAQIDVWKEVVQAVHAKRSKIFLQLWAFGRTANPAVAREEDFEIVSSSAVCVDLSQPETYATPRALREDEIRDWIASYAIAAKNAVHGAGFDGVEIHGANGYLVDQFNKETCNQRSDRWGGSIENRSRFAYEVAKACAEAVGPHRTAIRLSPYATFQGMALDDPIPQFTDLIQKLSSLQLAYLHLLWRSHRDPSTKPGGQIQFALDAWGQDSQRPVLICGWLTPASASRLVDVDFRDRNIGVVFGRSFMANPDLVFRIKNGITLKDSDKSDWYRVKETRGYTDEEFSREWKREVVQQEAWKDAERRDPVEDALDWGRCNA